MKLAVGIPDNRRPDRLKLHDRVCIPRPAALVTELASPQRLPRLEPLIEAQARLLYLESTLETRRTQTVNGIAAHTIEWPVAGTQKTSVGVTAAVVFRRRCLRQTQTEGGLH